MTAPQRILICRGGALGDLLLTFPLIGVVRKAWRDASVTLAAYAPQARLAQLGGLVDAVVSLDGAGPAEWFAPGPDLSPAEAAFLGSFDRVISFLHDPDRRFAGTLARAGATRVVTQSPLVQQGHATDHFLRVLPHLGLPLTAYAFERLSLPHAMEAEGAAQVSALGGNVVAIHPGSGSPRKNWPVAAFAASARRLADSRQLRPVFILGEAEAELAAPLARLCPDVVCLRHLSLESLAGLLRHCRAYIGNDSGVTHLAAAVGTPVWAIFGVTAPEMWAPRGPHVRTVHAGSATPDDLAREIVGQADYAE